MEATGGRRCTIGDGTSGLTAPRPRPSRSATASSQAAATRSSALNALPARPSSTARTAPCSGAARGSRNPVSSSLRANRTPLHNNRPRQGSRRTRYRGRTRATPPGRSQRGPIRLAGVRVPHRRAESDHVAVGVDVGALVLSLLMSSGSVTSAPPIATPEPVRATRFKVPMSATVSMHLTGRDVPMHPNERSVSRSKRSQSGSSESKCRRNREGSSRNERVSW